jgi:hypothetical protein
MFGHFNPVFIENAILKTFIYSSEMGTFGQKYFKPNPNYFTGNFKQTLAKLIAETLEKDEDKLQFELMKFELSLKEEYLQNMWLDILMQNPLGLDMAKKYHNKVLSAYKIEQKIAQRKCREY